MNCIPELKIEIPEHIAENELMEVILLIKSKKRSFGDKMNQLKEAVKDPMFLADMNAVTRNIVIDWRF